ncbi:hypothetical protein D9M71_426380 [compost metagenome]
MARYSVNLTRHLKVQRLQRCVTCLQAKADPGIAVISQLGLGEHRVFLQVGQLRFKQLAGHGQEKAIALRQDAKARLHAALDHAARAEAAGAVAQVVDVAGQLALQELAGVRAADGEDAFVG